MPGTRTLILTSADAQLSFRDVQGLVDHGFVDRDALHGSVNTGSAGSIPGQQPRFLEGVAEPAEVARGISLGALGMLRDDA